MSFSAHFPPLGLGSPSSKLQATPNSDFCLFNPTRLLLYAPVLQFANVYRTISGKNVKLMSWAFLQISSVFVVSSAFRKLLWLLCAIFRLFLKTVLVRCQLGLCKAEICFRENKTNLVLSPFLRCYHLIKDQRSG